MVDSGQAEIIGLGYENPGRRRLGLEAMTFAQLAARTRERVASSPIRADFHQLTVVRSGQGRASVDFVPHDCGPGTVLHVRPGQVQRLPAGPDGRLADLDAIVVLFTADFPPPLASLDLEFGPAVLSAPLSLIESATELESEYRLADETPLSIELLRQLLAVVLLRIARLPGQSNVGGTEVFRAFRREVEGSFTSTRDVQDYADRLGYAPRTLSRACAAATGKTAKQFIADRVTLEAKRLLVHTDLTIAAIGHAVGFGEPTNFGKFFARETGMTPGAFRARERP
jgi:AraC-like DNA-binding protein